MKNIEVEVGQVWRETDVRSGDRQFIVVAILPQLGRAPMVEVKNIAGRHTGRRSYIRLARLNPTLGKRGYELLDD